MPQARGETSGICLFPSRSLTLKGVVGARQSVVAAMAGFAVVVLAITMVVAARQTGHAQGRVAIGCPFMLVDDTGAPVTGETFAGKPYVIYFGYTYCPEVCPTTLVDLPRTGSKSR
jgi:cytochrome oxidase Cu insertion factor (SCO1/SenC/PrrC family)